MDWEYYIDSDFSNSLIRGGIFYYMYKFWHKNMVSFFLKLEKISKYNKFIKYN